MSAINMDGIYSVEKDKIPENTKKSNASTDSSTLTQIDLSDYMHKAFTKNNVVFIMWGLAILLCVYLISLAFRYSPNGQQTGGGMFSSQSSSASSVASSFSLSSMTFKIVDFAILGFAILMLVSLFMNKNEKQREELLESGYKKATDFVDTPTNIIISGLFLILFYFSMFIVGMPMSSGMKPITISIIETIGWCIFVAVIIVTFLKQFLGVNLTDYINGIVRVDEDDSPKVTGNISGNTYVSSIGSDGEVFNISSNVYSYEDAADVCSVFGTRLATYDEIEKAYNQGGEWCNYGWSEGQAVYFPTQKKTWEELQKSELTKNNCGRPGINGGYMANPNVKFGVNCFGKKPEASEKDKKFMEIQKNGSLSSRIKKGNDILLEKKLEFWKTHSDELLQINSFNRNAWSEY